MILYLLRFLKGVFHHLPMLLWIIKRKLLHFYASLLRLFAERLAADYTISDELNYKIVVYWPKILKRICIFLKNIAFILFCLIMRQKD